MAKLVAGDAAAGDQFGFSVAVDGDTAVIGVPRDDDKGTDSGSAYVFVRDGASWTQQAKLAAGDGAAGDQFGFSVAVDDDTVVIGAVLDDDKGNASGSAYVFVRGGSTWTQEAKLTAIDGAAGDQFAFAVDVDGGTAVIGAHHDNDKGSDAGSVYVFVRNGTTWTQQAKRTASDGSFGEEFGCSVAVNDDTAVIGARRDSDNGIFSGSAYVFTRSGTTWTQQAKLTAGDGAMFDHFGNSVAVGSDTAVIGARFNASKGADSGSAYVFTRSGTMWTQQAKLTASDGTTGDLFGTSVAVDGERVTISAPGDDESGNNAGSVYVFTRANSIWTESLKLLAMDGAALDLLGFPYGAVAVSGTTTVAGAPMHDLTSPTRTDPGAAYVFTLVTDDQGPVTNNVLANPNPVAINTDIVVSATIDDIATGGSLIASATYSLNGGPSNAMSASDGSFDSPTEAVTATIWGGLPVGVYDACVLGNDAAGNPGAADCTILAVYDPSAGFVTGGGWIDSPTGGYKADANLTGKANFGFVSKYRKGANVPEGNTQFVFRAGDLNFHSDTYEWLVVAGGKAQFKGVGTINGWGNFGFLIFATDGESTDAIGDVDSFRIQIWDRDNIDASIYDNGKEQILGGGSIVIHTTSKK